MEEEIEKEIEEIEKEIEEEIEEEIEKGGSSNEEEAEILERDGRRSSPTLSSCVGSWRNR
ncbi:hypothetical protein PTT_18874 [Pyrenophora teres f. teres 0-1]|uniref:Uncharacterized protein n=1 Tax=Pyrenophora teres f. teres (strain 0-1) TaxID=861557 RepID=E3S7Q5_PYRTT|nr:hypothetical protein PTT_18874 [Pyrenophora teres f. teres 0-1]